MTYGDTATRVLLSVIRQARPTVRSVAAEVGKSVKVTHAHLVKLRAAGLVEWVDGKAGTLRAMVAVAPAPICYNTGSRNETAPSGAVNSNPGPRRPLEGRL